MQSSRQELCLRLGEPWGCEATRHGQRSGRVSLPLQLVPAPARLFHTTVVPAAASVGSFPCRCKGFPAALSCCCLLPAVSSSLCPQPLQSWSHRLLISLQLPLGPWQDPQLQITAAHLAWGFSSEQGGAREGDFTGTK